MTAIRRACGRMPNDYKPNITFCIMQKNHHTRFFSDETQQLDRSGNLLPGLVVDTGIVVPTQFDFFLLSHSGIQGTSRPTYYIVLWDDNKFVFMGVS